MEPLVRAKDQLKLEITRKVRKKEIERKVAADALNVCERTLRRYLKAYEEKSFAFIRHGNLGRKPANRTPDSVKKEVCQLIEEKYFDFNVTHVKEKLSSDHGIDIPYTTLKRWHDRLKLRKVKTRRSKPRKSRERIKQEGYLLQLDGSHHQWFGGRLLCLMAAIDDANSEVFAKFYEGETTWACMDFLTEICQKKGVMHFVYTDKAGVYGGIKREHFSQVERALGELGANVIYAQSPEGKGRVERLFRTLQSRLVPELRLQGISSLEEANDYLTNIYLPHLHNPQFMVQAQNPVSAYRPLPPNTALEQIFCIKEHRIIAKDHTVSIKASKWMIANNLKYSIAGQKLEIRYNRWGDWEAFFAGKPIKLVAIKTPRKLA